MASAGNDGEPLDELLAADPSNRETPRHGFRGSRPTSGRRSIPAALTVAISREAGSRGSTIAARAGAKLGWPVYNQELLEYMAQEEAVRKDADSGLVPEASNWVESLVERLLRQECISRHPSVLGVARVVLGLAAQGEVVLVGRGAGLVLPRDSTLHVRVIAPPPDRVAYMTEWLRLTVDEAAQQVHQRDSRRAEFLATHFHHEADDLYQYDLILNSSLLGEDLCAELVAEAARTKLRSLLGESAPDRDIDPS